MGTEGAIVLAGLLKALKELKHLHLANNGIGPGGIHCLAEEIFNEEKSP